jgi:valyl-tRNA synthetase
MILRYSSRWRESSTFRLKLRACKKEASRLEGFRSGLRKKLDNDNFVKRAPAEVVAREKEKLSNTETKLSKIEQRLQGLSQ